LAKDGKLIREDDHLENIRLLLSKEVDHIPKTGIVHIGAHQGQEVQEYLRAGFMQIVLIEANPKWFSYLKKEFGHLSNVQIYQYAVSDKEGPVEFYVHTSRSGSTEPASLLRMKRFNQIVKTLNTPSTITIPSITLDGLFEKYALSLNEFNFLNVDVQGAELMVLKGAAKILESFDVVISEVNLVELYENAPLEEDIVEYMSQFQFFKKKAVYHNLYDEKGTFPAWGECLFVKSPSC
jgi:FkbM family methyltransferase